MSKHSLHPLDIAVCLHLVSEPDRSFAALAHDLGLSSSTVHQSVERLLNAGLVRRDPETGRAVNRRALLEFLEHGVRYAFPGVLGARARGVPTAYAGPALRDEIRSDEAVVWPAADGVGVGPTLEPLLPKARQLASTLPTLYALLTAVDAVRIGRVRERRLAMTYLTNSLRAARPGEAANSAH